jgi:hypothetical protein
MCPSPAAGFKSLIRCDRPCELSVTGSWCGLAPPCTANQTTQRGVATQSTMLAAFGAARLLPTLARGATLNWARAAAGPGAQLSDKLHKSVGANEIAFASQRHSPSTHFCHGLEPTTNTQLLLAAMGPLVACRGGVPTVLHWRYLLLRPPARCGKRDATHSRSVVLFNLTIQMHASWC